MSLQNSFDIGPQKAAENMIKTNELIKDSNDKIIEEVNKNAKEIKENIAKELEKKIEEKLYK